MNYDIAIVGAGPAGLSFARSLADTGLRIAVVDRQSELALAEPEFDGRDIALTHLSVQILGELGVWARLTDDDRSPIKAARVLDGQSPYVMNIGTGNTQPGVLGYLVSNHILRRALFEEVRRFDNIDIHTDITVTSVTTDDIRAAIGLSDGRRIESRLLVAADSRFSETRRVLGISASMYDFGRVCIVCRMAHERPHEGIAYECFQYGRTLAVLPLTGNRCSIVVTAPMSQRDSLMTMHAEQFGEDIRARFGGRYGDMRLISERHAYPLVAVHASKFVAKRAALLGDAAVGMHPVTAHGFNLGLSGQQLLAKEIRSAVARRSSIAASSLLGRYERKHRLSTRPMFHGTNEIVRLFTDERPLAKLARTLTLRVANRLPPIKRAIRNKLTEIPRP